MRQNKKYYLFDYEKRKFGIPHSAVCRIRKTDLDLHIQTDESIWNFIHKVAKQHDYDDALRIRIYMFMHDRRVEYRKLIGLDQNVQEFS